MPGVAVVHLRAGGEHSSGALAASCIIGSSPRGRGTRRLQGELDAKVRFIPARAGNTPLTKPARSPSPVHPRAGGEHSSRYSSTATPNGSSPRGRGTRRARRGRHVVQRFIPARAGNTESTPCGAPCPPVHPRAGGEHYPQFVGAAGNGGSSPRGRGTPIWWALAGAGTRFIPARAGNTRAASYLVADAAVHPRAGGEHFSATAQAGALIGSSPRGRGTLAPARLGPVGHRFIPARAGNTTNRIGGFSSDPVHPRAGGEHRPPPGTVAVPNGSSPRGRGTQQPLDRLDGQLRFIPARAGNTHASRPSRPPAPVHPRAGGEHSFCNVLIRPKFRH